HIGDTRIDALVGVGRVQHGNLCTVRGLLFRLRICLPPRPLGGEHGRGERRQGDECEARYPVRIHNGSILSPLATGSSISQTTGVESAPLCTRKMLPPRPPNSMDWI